MMNSAAVRVEDRSVDEAIQWISAFTLARRQQRIARRFIEWMADPDIGRHSTKCSRCGNDCQVPGLDPGRLTCESSGRTKALRTRGQFITVPQIFRRGGAWTSSDAMCCRSTSSIAKSIDRVFSIADEMEPYAQRKRITRVLEGAILGNMFFEPSTRTRISFGCAFNLLGGDVRETTEVKASSLAKGESLFDTARVLSGYSDIIVMRHPEAGSVAEFATASRVPVINAGDGPNEHPSQALLDLYTIRKEMTGRGAASIGLAHRDGRRSAIRTRGPFVVQAAGEIRRHSVQPRSRRPDSKRPTRSSRCCDRAAISVTLHNELAQGHPSRRHPVRDAHAGRTFPESGRSGSISGICFG